MKTKDHIRISLMMVAAAAVVAIGGCGSVQVSVETAQPRATPAPAATAGVSNTSPTPTATTITTAVATTEPTSAPTETAPVPTATEATEPTATADATPTESVTTIEITTTTSEGAAAESGRALPPEWYVDGDGNAVPDFIEVGMGFDPMIDDCLAGIAMCIPPGMLTGTPGISMSVFTSVTQGSAVTGTPKNLLLVLDSSGSMAAMAGDETRMDAAKAAFRDHVQSAPPNVSTGFMVYGHKGADSVGGKAASCAGIDVLAPLGQFDRSTVDSVLSQFNPTGWTPIARALEQARDAFAGRAGQDNHVVLISDGLETCGGDPVAQAKALREADIAVTVDVVGFGVKRNEEAALRRIAEAGGGRYLSVTLGSELRSNMVDYLRQMSQVMGNVRVQACKVQNRVGAVACLTKLRNAVTARISQARLANAIKRDPAVNRELDALAERININLDAQVRLIETALSGAQP